MERHGGGSCAPFPQDPLADCHLVPTCPKEGQPAPRGTIPIALSAKKNCFEGCSLYYRRSHSRATYETPNGTSVNCVCVYVCEYACFRTFIIEVNN